MHESHCIRTVRWYGAKRQVEIDLCCETLAGASKHKLPHLKAYCMSDRSLATVYSAFDCSEASTFWKISAEVRNPAAMKPVKGSMA